MRIVTLPTPITTPTNVEHCDRSKMADVSNRSPPQARSLPLGAQISCTTTHGDVLRGNIIATDQTNEAVVISILRMEYNMNCPIGLVYCTTTIDPSQLSCVTIDQYIYGEFLILTNR